LRYSTEMTVRVGEINILPQTYSYRVIQRLIQHCLLSKTVYMNVKYVVATRNYEFFYIYAKSHWKYHTFDRYYSFNCTKLRHKTQQKV